MKNTCRILAFAFCASLLFAACGTARAATYDKTLSITVTGVPENVTLMDFPLLVRLSESDITGFSYEDFRGTNGSDLRFETADGTGLVYDIDTWNDQGESLVWVKVPSLAKNDVLTMRYGSAAPDSNDPTAVWANYVGVWHFNSTSNSASASGSYPVSPIADSGTVFGVSGDEAAHLGSSFKNTNTGNKSRFKLGTTASNPLSALSNYPQFALSMWVKPTDTDSPSYRLFSTKNNYSETGFELLAISGSGTILRGNGSGNEFGWWTDGYQKLKSRSWTHQAFKVDGTAGTVFSDGTIKSGTLNGMTFNGDNGVAVGGYAGGSNTATPIVGFVDEVRLYNGVPANEYLAAEYAQVATSGYVSYGTVQNAAQDTPDISAAPAVVRNQDGTYTVTATIGGVAGNAYDLAVQFGSTTLWSTTWTATAEADTYALSFTSDGTEAVGTYAASVVATAPSGASARRTSDEIFLVGDITAAKGSDAQEQGLVAGSFILSRLGDATLPLTVSYTVSSETATAGVSYQAPSGTATFAAGESTVSVPITPLNDATLKADATLTLAVAVGSGLYGGFGNTADITLIDYAIPSGYNVWVATYDGNASSDSNWSLGRAPVATDNVLLGAWSSRNLTWDAAASHTVASWTQNADYNGQVVFPITYEGADVDAGFNLFTVSGDVSVLGGAWVHPVQGDSSKTSTEPVERYWLNVAVGGDFTVGSGVNISAQGRGRGFWTGGGFHARGIHAGYVITATNQMHDVVSDPLLVPFGSILEPVATGKGAARGDNGTDAPVTDGHGGGALHIVVGGTFSNAGRVIANGQSGSQVAGGAGGSIYVCAAAIAGAGTFEANASAPSGSGQHAASSGGRVSLIATGANAASATTASATGSRAPDYWQRENQPYWEGAAGTVWLQSGTARTLLVRNVVDSWSNGTRYDLGPYVRAYTPIPADDATPCRDAFSGATLYAASNARIRLLSSLRFATLQVRTETDTLAHVDLAGKRLTVDAVVNSQGDDLGIAKGTYTLADALANGWTWFEDSSATLNAEGTAIETAGTGTLVVRASGFSIIVR